MSTDDARFSSHAEYLDALEDIPSNPNPQDTLAEIINRREAIGRIIGIGALAVSPPTAFAAGQQPHAALTASRGFDFEEIAHGVDRTHHVSPGYRADILIRWGDPVTAGAPAFDPYAQSPAAQLQQFGYNNDFVGFVPLPFGSQNPEHGLLCINHEYTDAQMMFPQPGQGKPLSRQSMTEIEMAGNGGSVIEIKKTNDRWGLVGNSRYARRINALDTAMRIAGPAAGHPRMRTSADPEGLQVIGTLNNCAGGITPWGTYLMAEENFNKYFIGRLRGHPESRNFARYGVPGNGFGWGLFHPRFDINREPNEANRFGWIVEVDPLDPTSTPVKRTALGRFKHEGAACILNGDGRLVLYSGDDQAFEFLYRFVSRDRVDMDERGANHDLLDHGTLSVARFNDDGTLDWLPLTHGQAGLDASNGFRDQGDVVIEARRAASMLGATPMDRPEDVEPNPVNGRVYVMLTNNTARTQERLDGVNPRAHNAWGQVVELAPAGGDHAAGSARWELLIKAGDPADPGVDADWNPATSDNGWFACPDNCAIDPDGRLWVCTDQGSQWKHRSGTADGVWTLQTEGPGRGRGKMFFRVPVGAEMCGPCFNPDGRTLFVAVQHPGTAGAIHFPGFERSSTFGDPATRWPDFDPKMPPRPSVVVITRDDGGKIGG
ncbi:MAG: PhoX family phosphatase [Sedimenticolaceae bacterium]